VPALSARPEATLPVLDALCADPSEFVRRSVANHLNDISRIDPDLAVTTATRWGTVNGELPATVRHGLRTLVKQADPGALALLGFGSARDLRVDGPRLRAPRVAVGQALEFDYTVVNAGPVPLTTRRHYLGQHALELQVNGTRHGHVSFDLLMPEPADR
jgi:hypothetical protein